MTKTAPPEVKGHFHYDRDGTGFNYSKERMRIGDALDTLLRLAGEEAPPSFAIQSIQAPHCLPGFDAENRIKPPETVAVLVTVPGAVGVTLMVMAG